MRSAGEQAVLAHVATLWQSLALKNFTNGAVLFCSAEVSEVWHPARPQRGLELARGDRFDTTVVREALKVRRELTYGVVVVDGGEATLGTAQASVTGSGPPGAVTKLVHLSANIASRTRRGGQSAPRFSRTRDGEELAFLRKVAEAASEAFGDVRGLILGGRADMKCKLLAQLPHPLRSHVVRVVDLPCPAGLKGLKQAATHLGEVAQADQRQGTVEVVARFLDLVAQTEMHAAPLVCYGKAETLAALRLGAVDQLLVPVGGLGSQRWRELAAAVGAHLVEVGRADSAALRFCEGFGVGACLRYPVDPALLEEDLGSAEELPRNEEEPKPRPAPAADSDGDSASTATPRTDGVLLRWLQDALALALQDACAAESLSICAELVLFDESTPVEERVDSVSEMLRAEGVPEEVLVELACHAADHLDEGLP